MYLARHTVYLNLPYIGDQTTKLVAELYQLLNKFYSQINAKFYFTNNNSIGTFFKRCDKPDTLMSSSIIYEYTCNYSLQYIGSIQFQLFRRILQHRRVSLRTGRHHSKSDNSVIRNQCEQYDHPFNQDNFKTIDRSNNNSHLHILETLPIHTVRPSMNAD